MDESYFGGLEENKPERTKLKAGRGTVGKTAVVGAKDRVTKQVAARVIEATDKPALQGFVTEHTGDGTTVYTDESTAYRGMGRSHETVKHPVGEWGKGRAHTNGMESFWSMLKRAHKGTFHHFWAKHLQRYVNEFAGRQNIRAMAHIVARLIGKRLMYRDLIAE